MLSRARRGPPHAASRWPAAALHPHTLLRGCTVVVPTRQERPRAQRMCWKTSLGPADPPHLLCPEASLNKPHSWGNRMGQGAGIQSPSPSGWPCPCPEGWLLCSSLSRLHCPLPSSPLVLAGTPGVTAPGGRTVPYGLPATPLQTVPLLHSSWTQLCDVCFLPASY